MNLYEYLVTRCPLVKARADEDEELGLFNWSWAVGGDESREYFENLLGRSIDVEETVERVLDEAERKLTKQYVEGHVHEA